MLDTAEGKQWKLVFKVSNESGKSPKEIKVGKYSIMSIFHGHLKLP